MDISSGSNEKVKESKSASPSKKKLTPKQRKIIFSIIVVLLLVFAGIGIYKYAYDKGYDKGMEAGKKASASKSPTDLFSNLQNPFKTLTGSVEKLEGEKLTITTSKGEVKTLKITDKTKRTKKTETLNKDSLTKGAKVTIFTTGEGDSLSATRIVVR